MVVVVGGFVVVVVVVVVVGVEVVLVVVEVVLVVSGATVVVKTVVETAAEVSVVAGVTVDVVVEAAVVSVAGVVTEVVDAPTSEPLHAKHTNVSATRPVVHRLPAIGRGYGGRVGVVRDHWIGSPLIPRISSTRAVRTLPTDDRTRWNARHATTDGPGEPSTFLTSLAGVPEHGSALDLAGGMGRNALWLAERGLDVTLVDVSDVALEWAAEASAMRGLPLATLQRDLESDGLPIGIWDVVLCFHYLHRPLFAQIATALTPDGLLVCSIATVTNLERHDRPPRRYLLQLGELPGLVPDLVVEHYEEDWFEDRHEAHLVARRP